MNYFSLFLLLAIASGCMVGPDYHPPLTPMPEEYSEDREDETYVVSDEDLVQWWTVFCDPFLNELLEESIAGNFDYRIALEQVLQARAQYWVQFTQVLPEFDGSFTATRFKTSQAFASQSSSTTTISPYQNFFQCGFDAVWQIDLFGGLRRAARAAYDSWEAAGETAQAVKITVLSEVANTYAVITSFQEKVSIAKQVVDVDQELLLLASQRAVAGLANDQEVETAKASLELDQAALKAFEITLRQTIYSLAVLLGREPETLLEDFQEIRPIPQAEGKIPAGLPSDLLRRRPDIRSAERQLAAATEQIGVAVANLFPQVSLTGSSTSFASNPLQGANIGWSSDRIKKLFTPLSEIWGYGAFVSFPVFDFGKRDAAIDVQIALREQAYLNYQKTVITALQEVEQALTAYFNEEERLRHLAASVDASRKSLDLSTDLYQSGLANFTQVMQAKQIWLAALNTWTDSRQALTTDLIAIYKALGGDW